MIKRIEFTLNLDDPGDAALYALLASALRHRRAGTLIRQALAAFLGTGTPARSVMLPVQGPQASEPQPMSTGAVDEEMTARVMDRSASMFGF